MQTSNATSLERDFYELLKSDTKYLELIQDITITGFSYLELTPNGKAWFSKNLIKGLGYSENDAAHSHQWFKKIVHQDDWTLINKSGRDLPNNHSEPYETTVRCICSDGTTRHLKTVNFYIVDDVKGSLRLLTMYSDTTDLIQPTKSSNLLATEESYSVLFNRSRVGLGFLYKDETWGEINPALYGILERTSEEMINNPFDCFFSSLDKSQSYGIFSTLNEGKYKSIIFDKKILTTSGIYKWLRITVYKIENNYKYKFMVSLEDITEHIYLENNLRSKEKYYRQYFDLGLVGMGFCDSSLSIKESNPELCSIFDLNHEFIDRENWLAFFSEEDQERVKLGFRNLSEGKLKKYTDNFEITSWKRTSKTVSISVTPNITLEHQEKHFIIFIQDITQETKNIKEKEQALIKLHKAESIAKVGNWSYKLSDQKIEFSQEMWRVFGRKKHNDLKYKEFISWVRPDYQDFHNQMIRQILTMKVGTKFPQFTYPIVTEHGKDKWVQVSLEANFDNESNPSELFGVVMDITDNYKRTVAIQNLNEELTRSNSELERFAYVASHDLKAPLRAIKNLSSWIGEDIAEMANETTKNHLTLLGSRIDRMEAMLEGLLQYARVGTRSCDPTTLCLEKALDDIWSLLGGEGDIEFKKTLDIKKLSIPDTPFLLVLHNLISNSIKHGDTGLSKIEVHAYHDKRTDHYWFSVKDDGPGIHPRFHSKVFELFQSLKPKDELEANGLGLSMVQRVIQQYKGEIELHSNPHISRGTNIRFSWPVGSTLT
ncbi:PAS domain S-box protein [Vibrio comitans]|uniref:histidine kinase n=1 Tax=Vibrio comitans NBRC 102076 TaxID=1219078 RepID=A0A4Y3IT24_9VIBR|nr:PAS domain S-box protein [Vibrio comitans]GEA61948.1 hypothetical protein VCO01S_31410 [Vibrio comitans NBRC 102076]